MEELEDGVATSRGASGPTYAETGSKRVARTDGAAGSLPARGGGLVLVVDQLEELFTLTSDARNGMLS